MYRSYIEILSNIMHNTVNLAYPKRKFKKKRRSNVFITNTKRVTSSFHTRPMCKRILNTRFRYKKDGHGGFTRSVVSWSSSSHHIILCWSKHLRFYASPISYAKFRHRAFTAPNSNISIWRGESTLKARCLN